VSQVQRVSTGYKPRPLQAFLHKSLKRFNVVVCHRRFGKTHFSIMEMIDRGLRNPLKDPRYAYLSPLYSQSKRVAWDILKGYTENIPGRETNEQDLRVDIPRPALKDTVRFQLLGADNPGSLRGIYLDGVILDEYAEMNPAAWREVIRPTLSDRFTLGKDKGLPDPQGWAIFIGTPKGKNSFHDLYDGAMYGFPDENGVRNRREDWFAALFRADETGIIHPEELEAAKADMSDEEFEQEYLCSFNAGMVGAYFIKEMAQAEKDNRIRSVPYDAAIPVDTYWDLGINDVMSVWFIQTNGMAHQIVRYMQGADLSIEEWMKKLDKLPYRFGEFVLPHDGAARDLGTGKTRQETFRQHGAKRIRIVERQTVGDGISAMRKVMPKCYFDRENCHDGLRAINAYQRKWDAKQQVFSDHPMHNWASHGADAFRTFALGVRDSAPIDERSLPRTADSDYSIFTHANDTYSGGGFR
jgi:phage terminase large subunit